MLGTKHLGARVYTCRDKKKHLGLVIFRDKRLGITAVICRDKTLGITVESCAGTKKKHLGLECLGVKHVELQSYVGTKQLELE